ncbi:MAG: hypothetical protein K2N06_05720 [Oscillospiraceae bacterium]|nr:hypothetical protein [Oscillospiraceae bacterium]
MKLIRGIIVMVVFVIAGGFLTVVSIRDKVEFANRKDISAMGAKDFHAGQFVTGEIVELWDQFAYTRETNTDTNTTKTTDRYFAMPLESTFNDDEPMFIAIAVKNSSDVATARKMAEETNDWYLNDIEPDVWTTMKADGKVTKMDSEEYDAFLDYLNGQGYSAKNAVKYVVHIGGNADSSTALLIIGIVLLVVGLLVLTIIVLSFLRHRM